MDGGAWLTPFGPNPRVSSDEVQAAILRVLPSGYGLNITEIEGYMSPRYCRSAVQRALRNLDERGLLEKSGFGTGMRYKRRRRRVYDPGPMGANMMFGRKWEGYD